MNFTVVLPRIPYWRCLADLADCLAAGLIDAGHDVHQESVFGSHPGATEIVVGAHSGSVKLPDYPVVIYQTEVPGTSWFTENYRSRLSGALAIWEAAPGFLDQVDYPNPRKASVVEPGLVHSKRAAVPQDIDLLFYGSLSARRVTILQKLSDAGLKVEAHFGVFGDERNALLDRAKVVVDVKQRDDDPNDKTRTFFLDSRGVCLLTENDENASRALDPSRVVEQCQELLLDPEARRMHVAARRAELKPTNVAPAVRQLEQILGTRRSTNGAAAHA